MVLAIVIILVILACMVAPAIAAYIAVFFALRFLFRRLPNRRSKRIAVAVIVAAILAPYLHTLWTYYEFKREAASETVMSAPILLTPSDSVGLGDTYDCYAVCLHFLARERVAAVITKFGRWTLVRDPALCEASDGQFKIAFDHKALLAQGYCLQRTDTTEAATYTFRKEGSTHPKASPYRMVRSISDRENNILAREIAWGFDAILSPPFFYNVLISTRSTDDMGFFWAKYRVGDMSSTDTGFLERAFGISIDERRHQLGPVLIDDPQAAVASAARSPSREMQQSALALICALGQNRREEFREDLEFLKSSKHRDIQQAAERIAQPLPGDPTCAML